MRPTILSVCRDWAEMVDGSQLPKWSAKVARELWPQVRFELVITQSSPFSATEKSGLQSAFAASYGFDAPLRVSGPGSNGRRFSVAKMVESYMPTLAAGSASCVVFQQAGSSEALCPDSHVINPRSGSA